MAPIPGFFSSRHLAHALIAVVLAFSFGVAGAQTAASFPTKPLRFIVPVGAGSSTDVIARWAADRMGARLGVPVVVENKPGGEMVIGMQAFLQAPPDGHTLLFLLPTAIIINPVVMKDLPYDVERDVKPISGLFGAIAAIVVPAGSKYQSLADLVADAKARPGQVSMAWYAASYRVTLLEMERLGQIKLNLIPYKAPAQASNDVVAGTVSGTAMDASVALQLAKAGRVRILAVSGDKRHPQMPDVPTMIESGMDFSLYQLTGFGVHGKTPDDITKKVEDAMLGVVRSPEFRTYIEGLGHQVLPWDGAQTADALRKDRERYRRLLSNLAN